jgi:hypothetical protein
MYYLDFNIYLCGMCDEHFSDKIMIYKPYLSIKWSFDNETLVAEKVFNVIQLIEYVKTSKVIREALNDYELDNLSYITTYIKHNDYFLGMKCDRTISDIFRVLKTEHLEFVYFQVGGASLNSGKGYRFSVYCNEERHKNLPHVHVVKDGISARYSLETLEPIDCLTKPHKRDDKKHIRPFLEKERATLLDMWKYNMAGFSTPEISEDGFQYYNES